MKNFNIGLDFGTALTKVCVYDIENKIHEFFKFPNEKYFLESRIAVNFEGLVEYGNPGSKQFNQEYHYFKIASAEDEEFLWQTSLEPNKNPIKNNYLALNEYRQYSPEFLSVLYIAYVLALVRNKYVNKRTNSGILRGVLRRLTSSSDSKIDDTRITCKLGIPTEWSRIENLRRKRKFENILLYAELLREKLGSLSFHQTTSIEQLKEYIMSIQEDIEVLRQDEFYDLLNKKGLSVYPEAAAGLTFILQSRQLKPDYYASMDIGGGSTDISYFKVDDNYNIKYIASETYLMAANNVFQAYRTKNKKNLTLKSLEKKVQEKIQANSWKKDHNLERALIKVEKSLQKLFMKLFARRVRFYTPSSTSKFKDSLVITYGGGSSFPYLGAGNIEYWDNGQPSNLNAAHCMYRQQINSYGENVTIQPSYEVIKEIFHILVVALGLSFIRFDDGTDWFDNSQYNPKDFDPVLIPHPFNPDYFVYDVIQQKWAKTL
jgi:hypothetical protein